MVTLPSVDTAPSKAKLMIKFLSKAFITQK